MENFDFNAFTYQEMDITVDPSLYTFSNAPTTMDGVFKFTVQRTFVSNKAQQIVTMDAGNIIYTREYDTDTESFTTWLTNGGGSGSITSITSPNATITITNPSGPVVNLSQDLSIKSTTAPYSTLATDRIVQITNAGTVTLNSGTAVSGKIVTIVALGGDVPISATGLAGITVANGFSGSFYYNSTDTAWRIASDSSPGVTDITSSDSTIAVNMISPGTIDLTINNIEVVVNSSGNIISDTNMIYVNTDGTTQGLPLGSTVAPYKPYTIFNGNIATTAVVPQSPDLLNNSASAINITGAYNSMVFTYSPTQGWRVS